jgi:outer membrane immunogenic protein
VVDWSGLYVGLHAGYAWSDVDVELREPGGAVTALEFFGAPTGASHDLDGFLGGGHIGIQHQWGRWVLGVEAALSFADLRDRSTEPFAGQETLLGFPVAFWAGESSFRTEVDNFMSIAGRLGYAHDRWLVYAKGGFATAAIRTSGSVDGGFCAIILGCGDLGGSFSSRERHNGWLAGAGLEYMITPNLIVGLEYSYTDLGARTHTSSGPLFEIEGGAIFSGETRVRVDPDAIHAVTARVSIKLGRDEPAPRPMK